ncbi:MAG: GNAT family N-acetyltransferase [Gammaproteobacteria bacterium]|nr:GNAT family N-acetyltransferase [Gammaproteobacteria bacterium]
MDALVRLYNLPPLNEALVKAQKSDVDIRPAMAYEKSAVVQWIATHFSGAWADECSIAFTQTPIKCFVAVRKSKLVGFACYDCTFPNYFGPLGVQNEQRGKGIGYALLLSCLHALFTQGFRYAIIGGCDGQESYYVHAVDAQLIEGSETGAYPPKLSKN